MKPSHDVIIAGGGMVGMATAIALATAGIRSAVVEAIPAPRQLESRFDGRVSAIALGSKRLLEQIGAWEHMAGGAEPIKDIRVVDSYAPGFLHYDHTEVGDAPFGWIVENRRIREALFGRAEELAGSIDIHAPASIAAFTAEESMVHATLGDGQSFRAPLLIGADGRNSQIRTQAAIPATILPYRQTAIVCTIAHSLPHHGLALERFLPVGPFAVLPMQDDRSSLVWSESEERAKLLLSLPDKEFTEEIHRRVGDYLGEIRLAGPRFSYPLALVHAQRYTAHRIALIGDAAHAIHPIAGQGVNLGFRDVAALAEVITDAHRLGLDIGFETVLARYARWRSFDSLTMIAVTDALTRLSSRHNQLLAAVRRIGMTSVGKIPPLKQFFMRHAMGVVGDLPRLMQGKAL